MSDQDNRPTAVESGPPRQIANVPPQDLYATSDIRLVMIELGKLTTKVDRLIDDVAGLGGRLKSVETSVDRVRTGAIVAGTILSVVGLVFWWVLGDRITNAVRSGILGPPAAISVPQTPPAKAN